MVSDNGISIVRFYFAKNSQKVTNSYLLVSAHPFV